MCSLQHGPRVAGLKKEDSRYGRIEGRAGRGDSRGDNIMRFGEGEGGGERNKGFLKYERRICCRNEKYKG